MLSLLSLALRSGSCYQVVGSTVPREVNSDTRKDQALESALNDGGAPLVINKTNTTEILCIDRAGVDRGLEEFASKYPRYFADFMNERENEIAAYVFLRCCYPEK